MSAYIDIARRLRKERGCLVYVFVRKREKRGREGERKGRERAHACPREGIFG